MGRPINKRFFGNRNIGTTGTSDDAIGGEGVASVTINTVGSYTSSLPTVSFSTPNLPTGVRATGIVHAKALSAVVTSAGTGYNLGNILAQNVSSGNEGIYATWSVNSVTVVGITLKNGGTANDVGDEFVFNHVNFETPLRVRVTASNAGVATAVSIVSGGKWVTGALPSATDSGGFTRVQVSAGQDFNGQGLQVNMTEWGVSTVAVDSEGDYTAITSGAKATTATPAGGTGATLTITYGIKNVEITEKGSGYTSTGDAAPTFSAGAAAGTSVLTTESGNVGSSTRQENAIIAYAQTTTGGTNKMADIVKQSGSRRFRVKTDDGTSVCTLKYTGDADEVGEMTITAYDSDGGEYWVKKITAKKVTLISKDSGGGTQFADNSTARWTLGEAVEDSVVSLQNA